MDERSQPSLWPKLPNDSADTSVPFLGNTTLLWFLSFSTALWPPGNIVLEKPLGHRGPPRPRFSADMPPVLLTSPPWGPSSPDAGSSGPGSNATAGPNTCQDRGEAATSKGVSRGRTIRDSGMASWGRLLRSPAGSAQTCYSNPRRTLTSRAPCTHGGPATGAMTPSTGQHPEAKRS